MGGNRDESDQHLVRKIKEGRKEAFREIFLRYYEELSRFAYRYLKSQSLAEDVVQEAYTSIWEKRARWSPGPSIRVHLYQVVKHRALDYLKHKQVEEKYDESWMRQKERPTIRFKDTRRKQQLDRAVKDAIESLPDRAKMVYKLSRQEGLTYKEIAQILDISVKTVESQMGRSLEKLREKLQPYFPLLFVAYLSCMSW